MRMRAAVLEECGAPLAVQEVDLAKLRAGPSSSSGSSRAATTRPTPVVAFMP